MVVVFHSCSCDVAEEYEDRIKAYTKEFGGEEGRVAFDIDNFGKKTSRSSGLPLASRTIDWSG